MAVTTDPYTNSDLAAFIPEVWAPIVNEALFAKTVAANFFTDLSSYVADGGDKIHVPDAYTNVLSIQTQSTQGTEITTESVATVDTTITVDLHKYVAILMGDLSLQQVATKYGVTEVYTRQMSNLLKDALEDSLFALWSSLTGQTAAGDTATVLADVEIRTAIGAMEAANFPLNELAFFFHPYTFWNQLAGITKYYDASVAGSGSFIRDGNFGPMNPERGLRGQIYGIPVYLSSNVVSGLQTYRNLLVHPSAFGFAVQSSGGGRVKVSTTWENRNLAYLTTASIIYGVGVLRADAGVVINGSSSFIQS